MPAIRVYTSTGWQDVAQQGKPVEVYEQASQPASTTPGAIWIDTDDPPAAGAQYGPPLVTALPSSPYDGQEISLLVDAVNGIVWRMRYRAASPSSYKWEFLGGQPLHSFVYSPSAPIATSTWTSPADWAAVALPAAGLSGDYLVDFGARIDVSNIRTSANMGCAMVGYSQSASLTQNGTMYIGSVMGASLMARGRALGLTAAGWPLRCNYALFGSGPQTADVNFTSQWVSVLPIRLG